MTNENQEPTFVSGGGVVESSEEAPDLTMPSKNLTVDNAVAEQPSVAEDKDEDDGVNTISNPQTTTATRTSNTAVGTDNNNNNNNSRNSSSTGVLTETEIIMSGKQVDKVLKQENIDHDSQKETIVPNKNITDESSSSLPCSAATTTTTTTTTQKDDTVMDSMISKGSAKRPSLEMEPLSMFLLQSSPVTLTKKPTTLHSQPPPPPPLALVESAPLNNMKSNDDTTTAITSSKPSASTLDLIQPPALQQTPALNNTESHNVASTNTSNKLSVSTTTATATASLIASLPSVTDQAVNNNSMGSIGSIASIDSLMGADGPPPLIPHTQSTHPKLSDYEKRVRRKQAHYNSSPPPPPSTTATSTATSTATVAPAAASTQSAKQHDNSSPYPVIPRHLSTPSPGKARRKKRRSPRQEQQRQGMSPSSIANTLPSDLVPPICPPEEFASNNTSQQSSGLRRLQSLPSPVVSRAERRGGRSPRQEQLRQGMSPSSTVNKLPSDLVPPICPPEEFASNNTSEQSGGIRRLQSMPSPVMPRTERRGGVPTTPPVTTTGLVQALPSDLVPTVCPPEEFEANRPSCGLQSMSRPPHQATLPSDLAPLQELVSNRPPPAGRLQSMPSPVRSSHTERREEPTTTIQTSPSDLVPTSRSMASTLSRPRPIQRLHSAPPDSSPGMSDYERRAQRKRGQLAAMSNTKDTIATTPLAMPAMAPPLATNLQERPTTPAGRRPPPRSRNNSPTGSNMSNTSNHSEESLEGSDEEWMSLEGSSKDSRDRAARSPRRRRPPRQRNRTPSIELITTGNDSSASPATSPWGATAENTSLSDVEGNQSFGELSSSEGTFSDDDTLGELQTFDGDTTNNLNDMLQVPQLSADPQSMMPGAYAAQGRAIGDFPVWGRQGDREATTTTTPPPSVPSQPSNRRLGLRRSSTSNGSSFLSSSLLRRLSSRWLNTLGIHQRDVGVVEAHLVPDEESSEFLANRNAPLTVDAEMPVCDADNVVTDESIRQKQERFCVLSMLACLALVAILLGVTLRFTIGKLRDEGDDMDIENIPILQVFPTNETVLFEEWCDGIEDRFLPFQSPVVQCLCAEKLESIPAMTLVTFQGFEARLDDIGVFDHAMSNTMGRPDGTSCADPRNGALYWLAETETDYFRYSNQTLKERYALAVLFMATRGRHWKANQLWLTQMDVCNWGGINCESSSGESNATGTANNSGGELVRNITLSNHGLNGIIPPDLVFLVGLEVLSLADNVDLVGTVPGTLAEIEPFKILDLRGSSTDLSTTANQPNASLSYDWCSSNITVTVNCGVLCSDSC